MGKLVSFLEVSRWKIQLVSLATILLGPLYAADSLSSLLTLDLLLYAFLFLTTITFACNINCYHDREVDSLRKKNLARAVENLGEPLLRKIMIVESISAFILIIVFFIRGEPAVSILASLGWMLGYLYSAPPVRLKTRGILSPIPVNIGVYVLPILAGHLLISHELSTKFLFFVLGYAILNLGINLVNVAEDYQEDKKCGIKTIAHFVGIKNTISLAWSTTLIGGFIVLITLFPHIQNVPSAALYVMMGVFIFYTFVDILSIHFADDIKKETKKKGGKLPLYFIGTRYPMVLLLLVTLI